MTWVLAFLGFAALIILHEFGHFAAAKSVGMRVERFALFFPPLILRTRRGETEYGIGAVPLGGYVRITGMNPNEEIPPEVAHRAYYRQPVWKRIVVIGAGPAMNLLICFLILMGLFLANGKALTPDSVAARGLEPPAAGVLRGGDRIVSVDGRRGDPAAIAKQVNSHRCAGPPRAGCVAATPARVTVRRDGRLRTFELRPRYDASTGIRRMRIGFGYEARSTPVGLAQAASLSVTAMWDVSRKTVDTILGVFDPKTRKQLGSVVGGYEVTRQAIGLDATRALTILAFISLSLALINLFPFLPLDGGHIFWALAEKVRGRPIPFAIMERAGAVGFVLVILLFFVGLSNDIGRLSGDGFQVPR